MSGRNGLISTAELADILGQADLRLFDCTTYLEPAPEGSSLPYLAVPGRHTFEAGHIPGADFLDLQGEFSDPNTELRFMMPDVAHLEAAFGRHGVSNGSRVVLYSIGTPMWATRFWWMLTSLGFENVAVLDGGLDKWKLEGRPLETGPAKGYPPATFTAKPKDGFFVDKHETLAATSERGTVVVNALGPQFHKGLEPSRYGRPGRVPGSCNVSAATLLDPTDQGLRPACRGRSKIQGAGHHQRQARGRLLRRRHLGDDRSVPAAPARLRQPHALRRLDGRMGQGYVAADRDGLGRTFRSLHVIAGANAKQSSIHLPAREDGLLRATPAQRVAIRSDAAAFTPARSDPARPSDPACSRDRARQ